MFNYFVKHNEQNFWINNQQKIVIFDETSWLIIRCTNENLIEQINKNRFKIFHWTNAHNVKNWNKQNRDIVEHERRKIFFNNKSYEIDLQSLKKKMFNWIINWMSLFVENQKIMFIFINHIIEKQIICIKLSQNSFILFILYLFFNADLLKLIDRSKIKITIINFVNKINLLIYKKFTKKNYTILKCIHFACVQWTRRHDIIFVFEKYELIYLLRRTKRFNMCAIMKISDVTIKSKIDIKMLKLQINIKLKWHFHMKIIKIKMITQCMMLFKILIFT